MSTLRVTNIQDTAGGNSLTTAQLYNGSAKAWVSWNGTGAVGNQTLRASFNISSVSKSATALYTVNFTSLPDANYAMTCGIIQSGSGETGSIIIQSGTVPTASSVSVRASGNSSGPITFDPTYAFMVIHR
jgi:hypothetical protein